MPMSCYYNHKPTSVLEPQKVLRVACHSTWGCGRICKEDLGQPSHTHNTPDNFSLHGVSEEKVWREILRLDGTKSTPVGDIPAGMWKSTIDIYASVMTKIINLSLRNGCFPDDSKASEISLIFKKKMMTREGKLSTCQC